MRATLSLIRREFSAYFYSPIAYVVIAILLTVTGVLFYLSIQALTASGPTGISYPMDQFFSGTNGFIFWLVLTAMTPLLTMRLFAEERATGTLEMLMTAPVRDWQVVFAKFAACYAFYIFMWLPTLLYLPVLTGWTWTKSAVDLTEKEAVAGWITVAATIAIGVLLSLISTLYNFVQRRLAGGMIAFAAGLILAAGGSALFVPMYLDREWWTVSCSIDPWPVLTSYIGLALAGAMFLAIGMFVSSLVKSQMVAALIALFLGDFFIVGGIWKPDMDTGSLTAKIFYFFTVPEHFERNFGRGLIDTRNVVLYVSVALLGLFLTVRSLESRRWR